MSETKKQPAFWKSFVSGGFAGVGIIITGHPLDTVKVRLQTQTEGQYKGVVDCVQKTIKHEGFRGLYKGMATPLIGYTPMWALCFFGYDTGKRIQGKKLQDMNLAEIGLAGGISGFFTTLVMGPAERVKSLLQIQSSAATKLYDGPIDVVKKIGLRGTFQGTLATLYRDVPASAAYFGAYEATKRALVRPDGTVSTPSALFAGGMAGVMNWVVCMPMDVVKSRIQTAAVGSADTNFVFVLRKLLVNEGPIALYKGFGAVMIRAFPCNAIGFYLYDQCFTFLNTTFPEK
eukprot:c13513_g1_i1.p1 GENE.c13513_g1_i1~~c13513_g1_i1.p1  ORF type:complete len:315 (+),score=74.65 c13513_g1_i1:84-947(+)